MTNTEIAVREDALPATLAASTVLGIIAKAAADPAVDVAKMQALLQMQRELMADQARAEFNEAMARLQPRLPRITKKGEVRYPINKNQPDGPSRKAFNYARWEDIDAEIRPLLFEEGFSLSYDTEPQADGKVVVIATLSHRAGHSKSARAPALPLDTSGGKNNVQAAGSSSSYGKRYATSALLNLIFEGEDDDGVAGGTQLIDAESVKRLSDLLIETKSDLGKFCALFSVGGLPEIEVKDYPAAVNALLDKQKNMRGAP